MGKKDKDTPNPANVPNKDILQRLNFLYQASVYLTNLSQAVPPTAHIPTHRRGTTTGTGHPPHIDHATLSPECTKKRNERKRHRQRIRSADELARAYIDTMTKVGKRATVKMDPSIKRTLCKACRSVLVPGLSVAVRVRHSTSHRHAIELKCGTCGYGRSIPAPPRDLGAVSASGLEEETDLLDFDNSAGEDAAEDKGMGRAQEEQESNVTVVQDEELGFGERPEEDGPVQHTQTKESDKDEATKGAGRERRRRRRKDSDRMAGVETGLTRIYPSLPLALRPDAGHVVFCGNEIVGTDAEGVKKFGNGVFAV